MSAGYDIFRKQRLGSPVWITTVATRGQVEQTLQALAWVEPGDYFTREAGTREIVQGRETIEESAGQFSSVWATFR